MELELTVRTEIICIRVGKYPQTATGIFAPFMAARWGFRITEETGLS